MIPSWGGGAIPLEGKRLGLKVYGADLNPVAVMINKAMVEIPPRFNNLPPVNPKSRASLSGDEYPGSTGLAADVEYYGNLLKQKAFEKIGHLYPKVHYTDLSGDNREATVIAWIWARTVKCPNPACGAEVPLVHSFDLSKKNGHEYHIEVSYDSNKTVKFNVLPGLAKNLSGTIGKGKAACPCCGESFESKYIMHEGSNKRIDSKLMAIVAEGNNGRLYLPCDASHVKNEIRQFNHPSAKIPEKALGFGIQNYGFTDFSELFTNRQLFMLSTLIDLLSDVRNAAYNDALSYLPDDKTQLKDGGKGALAYSEALTVYLSFVIDRLADRNSSFCSWDSSREGLRNVFGRQAIPMVWDYAESNPFSNSSGCFDNMLEWVVKAVQNLPSGLDSGNMVQWDATQDNGLRNIMVSTDPPYYDNIEYSSLSDFFYLWLRASLQKVYPSLFSTIATPKSDELIASPFRFDGNKTKAKYFFENGMLATCRNIFKYSKKDVPVTIYYAFKQSDSDESGTASTGWETMLSAIIAAGFSITGTWPINTEMGNRNRSISSNALASSIVIVCRKYEGEKPSTTQRHFLDELRKEMVPALAKLQAANIAPVDLAQSAIGPGIAVYSKYKSITQADGTELSVRDALKLINRELDSHLNDQNPDMDMETSLALAMYKERGFNPWPFGDVNTLANAKNTSADNLARIGIAVSGKGEVRLISHKEIAPYSIGRNFNLWLFTQQTVKAFSDEGYAGIAGMFADLTDEQITRIKALCYQLFSIADKKGWTEEALIYNSMITSWDMAIGAVPSIKEARRAVVQPDLFDSVE